MASEHLDKIKQQLRLRSRAKGNITRIIRTIEDDTKITSESIKSRKTKLEEYYQTYITVQTVIDDLIDQHSLSELEIEQEEEKYQFEQYYYNCIDLLANCTPSIKPLTSEATQANVIGESTPPLQNLIVPLATTLQKLEIRPFDGCYREWSSFQDTFLNLVHNDDRIPPVQKFYHLKQALRGDLISIISNLDASEENYYVAWDLIKQRCNKPRKIIQSHLRELLSLPEVTRLSVIKIRELKEQAQMHVNALRALKEPVEAWDSFLVFIISQKLDKATRKAWEENLEDDYKPKFSELINFLSRKERGDLDSLTEEGTQNTHKPLIKSSNFNSSQRHSARRAQTYVGIQSQEQCAFCKKLHKIQACSQFLTLNTRDRIAAVREKQLCLNCLRSNHKTMQCRNPLNCIKCHKRHNTLLHLDSMLNSPNSNLTSRHSHDSEKQETTQISCTAILESEVFLGTARIKIFDNYNNSHECRVLLDGGSQCNFISTKLAERLNLKQNKINLPCSGLGQLTTRANFTVKAKIQSRVNQFKSELEFVALPRITGKLPSHHINKSTISVSKNIQLADPEFNKPSEIDALIGATLFYRLLCNGQIRPANNSSLTLQNTLLGWIVTGELQVQQKFKTPVVCNMITTKLENQLTRFWEIENIPEKIHLSEAERHCEEFYNKTTHRNEEGRYIVRLPFNHKKLNIGNSYNTALNRYYSLERKLLNNASLRENYCEFMREYHELGHMRDVTSTDNKTEGYFIPHFAVINAESTTTKTRVVFDASTKSTTNISLNEALLVGPTIQDELIFIIMRFRVHNVVLTADLKKMYRQIKIDDSDTKYQKILWRENPEDEIRVFELTTVTQGTATAPFLAARTLQQLAADEGARFELAAKCVKNDFYVDDLLTGANTIETALKLKNQLITLLKLGGFELHKWASNEPAILGQVHFTQQKQDALNISNIELPCMSPEDNTKKLLGIRWDATSDSLRYVVMPLIIKKPSTKRLILSEIAQLFDPLGILAPVIVTAKLIMQELWKARLDWDQLVTQEIDTTWRSFRKELLLINQFRVARKVVLSDWNNIQLHGFADASERAYGACVYVRSVNKFRQCAVHLICAKSRIAPLKTTTLPRLELCAALLLAQLIVKVKNSLKLSYNNITLWSDSTIVLHWLQASPHSLKTFVANRVAEIQLLTSNCQWKHIDTTENPADYVSRGQKPSEFINNKLWLHGPMWLAQNEGNWKILQLSQVEIPETRAKIALVCNTQPVNDTIERFSSITALNRFIAFCHRAVVNRNASEKLRGSYSVEELTQAHLQLIKIIQGAVYSREIAAMKAKERIHSKSEILTLSPFLDSDGIIRVGGRIMHANMNLSKKYPILLPRNNHITKLIIENAHVMHWHAGVQATLNAVRQRYWPIDGKNATRFIIKRCIRCCKLRPTIPNYVMGNLPKTRVTQSRPFQNVGLDYCGPFLIKEKKMRNTKRVKAYVAVFVCFTTKAAHMELVTDLSTETCLKALKRFMSRRGNPKNIYSDNATNFIGAKNEILKAQTFFLSDDHNTRSSRFCQGEEIHWHFSPPRSPHFSGLAEALVKSFKHHLYRTLGNALLTYEDFNTVIIEIEAVLNSRPLTPISSDPNDLIALTPAHFLIGDYFRDTIGSDCKDVPTTQCSAWQRIQSIKQHFWQRWNKEYLNELRTRNKWHNTDGIQIKVGTMVMIKEDNLPPMQWSLGRVIAVHPGADGVVRVATVKTHGGIYKRCVKKLAPLPVDT